MGSIAKAMKVALEATGYSELRDYQRKTIEAYLSGRDVFVYDPTGAGKSLTFELAPYTFDRLFGEDYDAIVLVIVPLISLMKDQVSDQTFAQSKQICSFDEGDTKNTQAFNRLSRSGISTFRH